MRAGEALRFVPEKSPQIGAVAEALLRARTLEGAEVEAIVEGVAARLRSVSEALRVELESVRIVGRCHDGRTVVEVELSGLEPRVAPSANDS